MVVVEFDPTLDLIYLEVEIVGPRRKGQFRFVLDTGCAETLITPEVVDEVGYSVRQAESITSVTTALGSEPGYRLRVARFSALGHSRLDHRVNVHDLPEGHGIQGLIGLDYLRHFHCDIRCDEGRILVTPAP